MGDETKVGQSSKVERSYAGIEHGALIDTFYETEGDLDIGRELSVRIFKHADVEENPWATPLIGRNGAQIRDEDDGRPLNLADYVNYAAKHHTDALGSILDFLMMQPGEPDYKAMRAGIVDRLKARKD